MALRSVALTDTLETFRTTFNSLGTDVGDLDNLNTTNKSNLVVAVNETLTKTSSFTIRDASSTVQEIVTGDTLNVVGDSNIGAVVSATDTLTISLSSTVTGLTSLDATTLTEGGVQVATKPFAIAQAIALG